jgi:hypothetical protein
VTLEPSTGSGANPIVHTGHEFVYCLTGRIVYTIEDRTFLLEPGDSLLFESHLPHRWHNADAGPSQALLVLYPADERDRPTERHFEFSRPFRGRLRDGRGSPTSLSVSLRTRILTAISSVLSRSVRPLVSLCADRIRPCGNLTILIITIITIIVRYIY